MISFSFPWIGRTVIAERSSESVQVLLLKRAIKRAADTLDSLEARGEHLFTPVEKLLCELLALSQPGELDAYFLFGSA